MKTKIFLALLVVVIVGVWFAKRTPATSETKQETASISQEVEVKEISILEDFGIKEGVAYKDAKNKILEAGWQVVLGETSSVTDFPEIKDCGEGIDRVCWVEFKKDTKTFGAMVVPPDTRNNESDNWLIFNKL